MRLLVIRDAPVMLFPDGPRSMVGFHIDLSETAAEDVAVLQFLHIRGGEASPVGTYVYNGHQILGSISWSVPQAQELEVALVVSSESVSPRLVEVSTTSGIGATWGPLLSNVTHSLAAFGDFPNSITDLARNVDVQDGRRELPPGSRTGVLSIVTRPAEVPHEWLYVCASTTSVGVGEWRLRLAHSDGDDSFNGYTGAFSGSLAVLLKHVEAPGEAAYAYDVTGSRNESITFLRWGLHVHPADLPFKLQRLDSRDVLGPPVGTTGC